MDWTLTTDRTAWELAAAVAIFLFCGVGASAFLKTSKMVAFSRFCFLLTATTLFVDPVLTRRVEEKPTVVLTLDDSASARRLLNVGGNERGNVDGETVWTRCVSLAKTAEDVARRRGLATELRTLSGRAVASFEELDKLEAPSSATSPLLKLAANGASRNLESGSENDVQRRERILLFSDGIQNGGVERAKGAKEVGGEGSSGSDGERESVVPVDAVAVGVSTGKLDWRWGVVDASSTVYPGGVASLRAELRLENGGFETSAAQEDKREEKGGGKGGGTRRAVVRLWETPVERNGEKETANAAESTKLVWERVVDVEIDANGGGVLQVERDWKPESNGVFDYFIFVADFDDAEKLGANWVADVENLSAFDFFEFCLSNNAARFRVEAKSKKLDVLLVDDEPRYEYRYLRELLRREESVALKTFLFSVDDAVREGDETALAPRDLTRRRLAEFDAILIGDVPLERWAGKAQTLVDVATQDGSETSIWLLGGAKTFQTGESGESLAALLAPNLLNGESKANGEEASDGAWRLFPTPRGREIFAGLTDFWTALDANEAGSGVEFWRVEDGWAPGVGAETLFNARNASTERETPLFVVATLGKNKVLAQGTDELWRLRTLGDKTIYRRFVLRALEFLTDGGDAEQAEDAAFANALSAEESAGGSTENGESGNDAAFDSGVEKRKIKSAEKTRAAHALETQDVAARIDVLQEIARTTGGETLDLRDLDEETARAAATAFFERRFGEYPNVVVERSTRTPGKNWLFAALFVFWSVAWAVERRLDGAR